MHFTLDHLNGRKPRIVAVPAGNGVDAYLREMTPNERDERLEVAWLETEHAKTGVGFRAWVVAASLCDPEGNWLFPDVASITTAAKQLGEGPHGQVVTRCFIEAKPLQLLSKEDVEALEKN